MKRLHTFVINKIVEKDVPTAEKDKDGKDITVVRKQKTEEPNTYLIKRPTRSDHDSAELFHDISFGKDVRAGILTRSEIIKRFANEDVVIKKVYEDYAAKENELQRINLSEKSEENVARRQKIESELLGILMDIQNFEANKSSVFEHTSENRARNKTVFWWILNLAYKIVDGKEQPIFEGEDFDAKLESYDRLQDSDDEHIKEAIQRYFYFIPIWYSGQITREEDFKKAEDLLNAQIKKNKEDQADQEKAQKEQEAFDKGGFIPNYPGPALQAELDAKAKIKELNSEPKSEEAAKE